MISHCFNNNCYFLSIAKISKYCKASSFFETAKFENMNFKSLELQTCKNEFWSLNMCTNYGCTSKQRFTLNYNLSYKKKLRCMSSRPFLTTIQLHRLKNFRQFLSTIQFWTLAKVINLTAKNMNRQSSSVKDDRIIHYKEDWNKMQCK